MTKCRLAAALLQALTGAELIGHKQQPWYSATFAGERVTLQFMLKGEDGKARAAAFAEWLPEVEFDLGQHMVADIVVTEITPIEPDMLRLTVEALLLDE